jgi:putative heme-binding domain-containing protein
MRPSEPFGNQPGRTTALLAVLVLFTPSEGASAQAVATTDQDLTAGRSAYIASCARCHGVDGGGGEGPPLARARLPRAPDDDALIGIMVNGIPGTGMSGSWFLSEIELQNIARYVRSLAPSGADEVNHLTGDPSRGRMLYESEGCDACHTVGGFGTARGPDLSTVGGRRGPSHLRESIVDPASALPRGLTAMPTDFVDYLIVRVVDAGGREIRGMRMNEDSYTIQIKDRRGALHSFYKPDLRELEKEFDRSLMRSYRDRLTEEEVEDLVAYLAALTGAGLRGIS